MFIQYYHCHLEGTINKKKGKKRKDNENSNEFFDHLNFETNKRNKQKRTGRLK